MRLDQFIAATYDPKLRIITLFFLGAQLEQVILRTRVR
jgi:hypothetical protein